ncbi:phenylalanine--tRNA ligase subunit beta [Paenibacillus sp. F411]|uniref:phenylalanine--tRNA ligase subunit beta n=1 Tax=Paenibacillus sp. F411 TaxID=2820239 RepID=UPI001AAE5272|nr:phenylalanine--tRNA ligase subunit beta [Paenibacillus sp. F411]MBO2943493.1 phenylalanine--tRNA ligase subunit beta [Paenibacillus sp. F411]
MRVSTEWLSQYISLSEVTAPELARRITAAGIEIDVIENRNQGIHKVVTGYVKSKEKHPDADKLNVCIVDAGLDEDIQIVCGAKNVDAGQKVPVALVGAKLPGGLDIKKAKLRGVVSQGMICSAKELGMNDKLLPKELQEGILVLPEQTVIGLPIEDVLGLNDQVLELDLTPNRSDCLSMLGTAYEVSAILGRELALPDPQEQLVEVSRAAAEHISVAIEAEEQCPHYSARYITGVTVGTSPLWMQNRLMAAGIRPINNIVDITNYVMLEYGQPLHAFDADRLPGGGVTVRLAREGESMVTLDGQERKLEPHMLVIAGENGPAALAGVMGGLHSEVTDQTVNIMLESARFDGGTVRKTSRQLGLRSEASSRFEKEVDPAAVIPALNRAAALMAEYAGGAVHQGVVQAGSDVTEKTTITLSLSKVNKLLGTALSLLEVKTLFSRLHFPFGDAGEDHIEVEVPTRRGDITLDVDLIEEIARLYGYDNIPTSAIEGETTPGSLTKPQMVRRALRRFLTHGGWQEVLGYSFIDPQQAKTFHSLVPGRKAVPLSMPMSEDRSVLRTSLLPQLLDMAVYNMNRKQPDLALFELGNLFHTEEDQLTRQPEEQPALALLLTGRQGMKQWNVQPQPVDFFDLKGAVESILHYLGVTADQVKYKADEPTDYHPGRSATLYADTPLGEVKLGTLGQLHPQLQQDKDLEDTYVAELLLAPLYELVNSTVVYRDLPRYPGMERDLAIVVDEQVEAAALIETVQKHAGDLLQRVRVFDVFKGSKLGEGKKSIAISLSFRHQERTLTDEEVSSAVETAVAALEQSFGAELRK